MAKERKIVDLTKDAEKGRKYDLSKDGEELSRVRVDLTWKSVLDLDATALTNPELESPTNSFKAAIFVLFSLI